MTNYVTTCEINSVIYISKQVPNVVSRVIIVMSSVSVDLVMKYTESREMYMSTVRVDPYGQEYLECAVCLITLRSNKLNTLGTLQCDVQQVRQSSVSS